MITKGIFDILSKKLDKNTKEQQKFNVDNQKYLDEIKESKILTEKQEKKLMN